MTCSHYVHFLLCFLLPSPLVAGLVHVDCVMLKVLLASQWTRDCSLSLSVWQGRGSKKDVVACGAKCHMQRLPNNKSPYTQMHVRAKRISNATKRIQSFKLHKHDSAPLTTQSTTTSCRSERLGIKRKIQ